MRKTSGSKIRTRQFYDSRPWQCAPCSGGYEISAFVEASGKCEPVATVRKTSGASAAALARYIIAIVNAQQDEGNLLPEALAALEAISSEGLNFSTEHDADVVIRRLKKHGIGGKK